MDVTYKIGDFVRVKASLVREKTWNEITLRNKEVKEILEGVITGATYKKAGKLSHEDYGCDFTIHESIFVYKVNLSMLGLPIFVTPENLKLIMPLDLPTQASRSPYV